MTRKKWADLRDAHLRTPEDRARFERAQQILDAKLAAYHAIEELVPNAVDLAELWEAIDDLQDSDPNSLRRRLWAIAHERGLVASPEPPAHEEVHDG